MVKCEDCEKEFDSKKLKLRIKDESLMRPFLVSNNKLLCNKCKKIEDRLCKVLGELIDRVECRYGDLRYRLVSNYDKQLAIDEIINLFKEK